MKTRKFFNIKTMSKVSILAAIATILMMFDFPLPFIAPPFYKLDFSDVAALVGGFALGPVAGIAIEGLKNFLNVLFTGSSTAYVGELSNFITGCAFVVPACLIYHKKKTAKQALLGLVVGVLVMTFVGTLSNYFIMLPAYSFFYQLPLDTIIKMGSAIFPMITDTFTFVLFCTIPFNLIKGIVISTFVFALYKHISPLLKR